MIFFKKIYNILKNKEASIIKSLNFRKAADGGNLVIIGVAIGVLIVIGLYYMSQSVMKDNVLVQDNVNSALQQGIQELKK